MVAFAQLPRFFHSGPAAGHGSGTVAWDDLLGWAGRALNPQLATLRYR